MTYADGSKHDGEWKDDKKHGQGIHTDPQGKVTQGRWEEDKLVA